MTQQSENGGNYITLTEAKEQLAIDEGLTIHDDRIKRLIGTVIDWAENLTQRSLGELLELNSPTDSSAVPLPDPKDSPSFPRVDEPIELDRSTWTDEQWREYWANNPILVDSSKSLRRDVKEALLLKLESLFDRNPETMGPLAELAVEMIWPYRKGMGV